MAMEAGYVPHNKHPLRVGIPGRMYSPYDYVSPICDSMTSMHERGYATGMLYVAEREERGKRRARDDETTLLYTMKRFKAPSMGILCSNCNNKDHSKLLISQEGTYVCSCGAEVACEFRNDYKDLNDTGKSAARADAPSGKSPVSIDSTVVPAAARRKFGIGYAHENATRSADRLKLSRGNTRKLTAVIESISNHLVQMAPVDNEIAKKVKLDAEAVFYASVHHHERCQKKYCQKALFNKPASVIAAKSFVHTVEQLSIGEGVAGVSRQTVTALQERVQCSPVFNQRDNATQHHTCLAMISALLTTDNDAVCPDAPVEPTPLAKGVTIQRQRSDVQSSPAVQLRDAISTLSAEYGYPQKVRECAMLALQDGDFAALLKSNRVLPKESSKMACAFIVLQSISEDSAGTADRARRVGLRADEVAPLVSRMRAALPQRVLSSDADDDDLY